MDPTNRRGLLAARAATLGGPGAAAAAGRNALAIARATRSIVAARELKRLGQTLGAS